MMTTPESPQTPANDRDLFDEDEDDNPPAPPPDPYERFVIDTDEKADWYLGKITALVDERRRFVAAHEARMDAIRRELVSLGNRFDAEFEHYITQRIAEGKGRSLILNHGEVKIRTVARSLSVADEKAAREYINDREDDWGDHLLIQTTSLDKAEFIKYAKQELKENGELLPGILVKPAHDKFGYEGREEILKARAKDIAAEQTPAEEEGTDGGE